MIARTISRWLTPPVSPWRVILLATIPFWAYLTLHDIIIYESYVLGGTPREMIAAPQVRALQHLLLLPLALFAYRGAWRIGWPEQDRVVAFVGQVLLALAFASLARAALTVSMTVAGWNPALEKMDAFGKASEFEMMRDPFFWLLYTPALWARATTEFFFVYWFGLALVVGLRFYLDLRDQKLAASRLREDWLKARLDALSGQLNPHFLFNSLNTVSSFVRGNPDRAETILADLSQLLRTSLRERTRPLVPVADEIEFIERYLAIEGTRFEDRLKVELEADAEVLNARIPSLLLQPLVENAIKHGVSRSRGPASLAVRIGRDGDELRVLIENSHRAGENGRGSGESVGLRNVRERLDTLYAKRHSFAAGPQGDAWRVEIRIPYEQET